MHRAALDWATGVVLTQEPAGYSARTVLFLLRLYVAAGGDDLRVAVEHGLTRGLDAAASAPDVPERLAWLRLLAEAGTLSDDERLQTAVRDGLPAAVDALEAEIRRAYEPGDGLLDQSCADHLRCANGLLAAFDLSERLPYGMLAEELLQHARRRWWREAEGAFDADFAANCAALQALVRLAALHADPAYRAAAVVAPLGGYGAVARQLAAWVSRRSGEHPQHAGDLGAALLEWFALEGNLQ